MKEVSLDERVKEIDEIKDSAKMFKAVNMLKCLQETVISPKIEEPRL